MMSEAASQYMAHYPTKNNYPRKNCFIFRTETKYVDFSQTFQTLPLVCICTLCISNLFAMFPNKLRRGLLKDDCFLSDGMWMRRDRL